MTTLPTLSAPVIESDRVVLRRARDADREGIIEVMTDPVIADRQTDQFIGTLRLDRRAAYRPGHVTGEGRELELSYVLRRGAWGAGLAFEATAAALRAAAGELPDQPVLIVTQAANDRSRKLAGRLDFQEMSQFEEFDARQVLAVAPLGSFRAPLPAGPANLRGASVHDLVPTSVSRCQLP